MRILFITHRLPYSSVKHAGGYYQYSLIKALKSRGINVDLLSFVNDEELKHIEEISKEKADDYTEIKRCIKKYVSLVMPHMFKESAQLDAKFNKALSYSAHVMALSRNRVIS